MSAQLAYQLHNAARQSKNVNGAGVVAKENELRRRVELHGGAWRADRVMAQLLATALGAVPHHGFVLTATEDLMQHARIDET